MTSYLLIFLLFLLQFVYAPVGNSFFEGSKVLVAELLIALLGAVIFLRKSTLSLHNYKRSFLYALGVIFVISLVHVITDQSKTVLFGNIFRQQGTVLLWFLLLFSLISARINIKKKYLQIVIFLALVVQVFCAVFFVGVNADRPVGTIGEPNALAASVLFLWPFLYYRDEKSLTTQWWIRLVGFLPVIYILIISGSRSGLIAFGVQIAFLLLQRFVFQKLSMVVIGSLLLLLASYSLPVLSHGDLYENRGEIWQSALVAGSYHPLIGIGFGNAEYSLHRANLQLHNHLPGYYVDSAHNIFLDWWVEAGIIGVGAMIFLIYQTFRHFTAQKQVRNLVLLLGLVAALSFNPASVVSLIALWWMIGQASLVSSKAKQNK